MAGENEVAVDIGVGSNELEGQLRRTFDLMTLGLQRAEGIRASLEKSADQARRFGNEVAAGQKKLAEATTDQARADAGRDLAELTKRQREHNEALAKEVRLHQELAAARRTGALGRAAGEVRGGESGSAEQALRGALAGISTTADQLTNRLALATGKAMERLLGATTKAMEDSYLVAIRRQESRMAQAPGDLAARAANDRVATPVRASTFTDRSAELRARQDADNENRMRREAERQSEAQWRRLRAAADVSVRREAEAPRETPREASRPSPASLPPRGMPEAQLRRAPESRSAEAGGEASSLQAQLKAKYTRISEITNSVTEGLAEFGPFTEGLKGTLTALVKFDEGLKQFQATTGATNTEMAAFRGTLLGVAADSKFSVEEITQVAIALGQTGLAAGGVSQALKPVMNLAAASGQTLQQSAEAVTAVLGAYNMEASRAGTVADVFVAALDRTKLSMGQLQLGIQHAAGIARESGVSFSELTASVGAVAQSGVRSGESIGTGLRQLITELSAPTEKLRGVLKELGIGLDEVDLRTQGFTSVLTTLQEKGFGTSEAMRALDKGAAGVFSALAGQGGKVALMQQEFLLTSSAAEAAAKSNESFSAAGQRLLNTLLAIADKGFRPLIELMALGTGGIADLLKGVTDYGTALPLIAAGLTSVAAASRTITAVNAIGGALGLAGGAAVLGAGALLPVAGAIAVGGGLIYALTQIQTEADKARARIDALKTIGNELTGRQQSIQANVEDIDKRIQTLSDRRERLNSDPVLARNAVLEAQKAFGDLGLVVEGGATNIDGLIAALRKLRGELNQEMPQVLTQQLESLDQRIAQSEKLQAIEARRRQTEGKGVTNLGAVRLGAKPIFAKGKMGEYAEMGEDFAEVAEYLQGKKVIDPDNVRGSTADLTLSILNQLQTLRTARNQVMLDETSMKPTERADLLDKLDGRIKLVEEAFSAFADHVAKAANLQALRVQRDLLGIQNEAATIKLTPAYKALEAQGAQLAEKRDANIRDAGVGPARKGTLDDMQAAARLTDGEARGGLAEIEAQKKKALAEGRSQASVDQAYAPLIGKFNGLIKGYSDQSRERFDEVTPTVRAQLQSSIRIGEGQLAQIARQAGQADKAARVGELETLAKSVQAEINAAREQLFKVELGPNADAKLADSAELREKGEALRQQGREKIDQLGQTYAEAHRKVQDQTLASQIGDQQDRKALIESQIKGLEKVRDDVRSTPEQMSAAVQEINRLLGEVARIGQTINGLNAQREGLRGDQRSTGAKVTFEPGSVKQQIVDGLRAAGADEARIRYALNSAQMESQYDSDVISGARRSPTGATGLFQFLPSTWEDMYGTTKVSTDFGDQLRAFQKFTSRNAGAFQSNMGRAASDEELYLMHQQGAAGAMGLLRAGSGSALAVLTAARSSRPNAEKLASLAITKNGGRLDMSADEFSQLILRKYRLAGNVVGNPFDSTPEAEAKRRLQNANDKTAQDKEDAIQDNLRKEAAKKRADALAELKATDATETETYATRTAAIRRATTVDEARAADKEATESLKKLFGLANSQDAQQLDPKDVPAVTKAREARRKQFSEMAQDQALAAAEAVGRTQSKSLNDMIAKREGEKRLLERPENAAKEGNAARLDLIKQEIEALTKRRDIEGDSEANRQKLLILEQSLRDMEANGLGDASKQLRVQAQIAELKDRQRQGEPVRKLAEEQEKKAPTYGGAFQEGLRESLKSRGILDDVGKVVEETAQARKTIAESLNVIGGAFDNLWVNLMNGSMKAGDALKKFATDILGGLMSQISKSLTNSLFKALFTTDTPGGGGGGVGGGFVDFITDMFGGAKYFGGPILRRAGGGAIPGGDAALRDRDSQLILAQPDEYLLRKSAVDFIGRDTLDQVNALGGRMVARAAPVNPGTKLGGASATTSVYVVDRDQVPVPGPNEMVYAIGDNIQRGGTIAQLIKRVQVGG